MSAVFDAQCTECPRLAGFLAQVRTDYPTYYARPVAAFGDVEPRLLIVGLAPGLHGANRSGRPFTGDYAGILLYETLHQFGYASAPVSTRVDDGLVLQGCRITNAVKCLPPANKPETAEIRQCNHYLQAELAGLPANISILALGAVAHAAVLMACGVPAKAHKFAHGAVHELASGQRLYDSYHCSRYNTNTRRLTPEMFKAVFAKIKSDNG
ncbi:uracil-DNA glycosylase [Sulfuriferula nivalis]|uniref:Type-5 uracil-DNA glycosylase n=1 Tax=Sulfuriferula nivalis TaxID=2675298 RepID=A0A809SAA0_9PROT|nr:uracil-DNA glycosylase [Sulfuriferula nivalis]BBP01853.1 uracil-DNA glycosylase [Sulfuriferula nivalis]